MKTLDSKFEHDDIHLNSNRLNVDIVEFLAIHINDLFDFTIGFLLLLLLLLFWFHFKIN